MLLNKSLWTMALLVAGSSSFAAGATIHVPQDHKSIQAALDAASPGDTVLVSAGTYKERVRLTPGVTLKSSGDDQQGEIGLKRAEATILDGNYPDAAGAGVTMAEGATLDGFTVTGVGKYDEELWKKYYATQGEEQREEDIGVPGVAGIEVSGVEWCTVSNNIVHHIGYSGIAISGAEGKRVSPHIVRNIAYRNMGGGIASMKHSTAIVEGNTCFENYFAGIGHSHASPLVFDNLCYGNIRAGIGISAGSCPTVRDNKCYNNRRAGIGIRTGEDTQPVVEHNECYENDMAGIGSRDDARPIIRHNRCYKNKMAGIGTRDGARPIIEFNECFENEMAGIGSRLHAAPVIRNNRCYRNQMAGIGAREEARPVIEDNECFENKMAGIGSQQEALAIIRNNRCYRNEMAGIGSKLGARPVIVENECYENVMAGIGVQQGARAVIVNNESRENQQAGIGVRDKASAAIIIGNQCLENRLVAIGLPDGASGFIHGNELLRTEGGAPPLVAMKGGSVGVVSQNIIQGGGVAGVLVQGDVQVLGNRFHGKGAGQGSAVWVWKDSQATVSNNRVEGYRNTVNASGSQVTATGNVTRQFEGPAIIVKSPTGEPLVYGNTAISENPKDTAVNVDGTANASDSNILKKPEDADESLFDGLTTWPIVSREANEDADSSPEGALNQVVVQEAPWKLVVTYGKTTTYQLFDLERDPQEKHDLSQALEQITFRLRGQAERQETLQFQEKLQNR